MNIGEVRWFEPPSGTGLIRVNREEAGYFWRRLHSNGTVSRGLRPCGFMEAAVDAAGGQVDKPCVAPQVNAMWRLNEPPREKLLKLRPSELVQRLRRLDINELNYEQRLVRDLWEVVVQDSHLVDRLPPGVASEVSLLIDRLAIKRTLESLPINHEDCLTRPERAMFFVLTAGKWWPAEHGKTNTSGSIRWLNASVRDASGGVSAVVARWPEWAHVSADGTPCIE